MTTIADKSARYLERFLRGRAEIESIDALGDDLLVVNWEQING